MLPEIMMENHMHDSHLQRILDNYQPAGFIASKIFPILLVDNSDCYNPAYECRQYKIKADVTLQDLTSADPIFIRQFEEGRCMRSMDALYLDWEMRMANIFASVATTYEPPVPWTDYSKSYPYDDLLTCKYGIDPTHILMSGTAWRNFRRNVEVMEMCGQSEGLYPSLHQVEDLLRMKVLVGVAWMNQSKDKSSANLTQVWGDSVYLYHIPEKPNLKIASFGYVVRTQPLNVERLPYDTRGHVQNIEITLIQDEIIVDRTMGVAIRNTVMSN